MHTLRILNIFNTKTDKYPIRYVNKIVKGEELFSITKF